MKLITTRTVPLFANGKSFDNRQAELKKLLDQTKTLIIFPLEVLIEGTRVDFEALKISEPDCEMIPYYRLEDLVDDTAFGIALEYATKQNLCFFIKSNEESRIAPFHKFISKYLEKEKRAPEGTYALINFEDHMVKIDLGQPNPAQKAEKRPRKPTITKKEKEDALKKSIREKYLREIGIK